ncbi:MAG: hypothetical protein KTR31_41035 [Myxococcales bacterium]|nr:hypothetical protein [Myxococcales bacterium]
MCWWLVAAPTVSWAQVEDVVFSAERTGSATSVLVTRGHGLTLGVEAQVMPGLSSPTGFDFVPVMPRLSVGWGTGDTLRVAGSVHAHGAASTDGVDRGLGGGASLGAALASPGRRVWTGFELDAGWLNFRSFDDIYRNLFVGLDTIAALDVDPTTSLFLRFGGLVSSQREDTVRRGQRSSTTFAPRIGFGAGYRLTERTLVSLGGRIAVRGYKPRASISAALGLGWQLGRSTPQPPPPPPPVVPIEDRLRLVEHPELVCPEGTYPVGQPPPYGTEAWCIRVGDDEQLLRHGPYLRWHDAAVVAERGHYTDGLRSGTWTTTFPDGAPLSEGAYVAGRKDGPWQQRYASGDTASEGAWVEGVRHGPWTYTALDGVTTTGAWTLGQRQGTWIDVDAEGTKIRTRSYRDGKLKHQSEP